MKKGKALAIFFASCAFLLTNVMCAVVAYNYCDMLYGIAYRGYSAPASTAFFFAIPFSLAILLCVFLAIFFLRKARK